jgi:drug/metabolite transporter (DMT)-like permease
MLATLVGSGAIVLWSCLALLTAASGTVPPFELAAMTFAIGGTVGLVVMAARRRLTVLRQPAAVWLVGVGGLFGYHALYFAALRAAPPAQAGLIAYLWPLLIVLFSAALPGEGLGLRHVLGACLGLAGSALLLLANGSGATGFEARFSLGYLLALACAFVWSSYSVLSRRMASVPTETVAGFCLVTAALSLLAHAAFEQTVWPRAGAESLAIVALGVGPVGAAFYLWDYGVKNGDIRTLGVASYAAPVLSTLLLVACGYAQASGSLALSCGLIVAGAAVATFGRSKREKAGLEASET